MKIAIIPPTEHSDYLLTTILDGVLDLQTEGVAIECKFIKGYPHYFAKEAIACELDYEQFLAYAKSADVIFLAYRYKETDLKTAEKINRWDKTVFIDGSECKHDNRLDSRIQYDILRGTHRGPGAVQYELLKKSALYVRREKPYLDGIFPFPFGIERRYKKYNASTVKDIDFVCIFGQNAYPQLRKYVTYVLEEFCRNNGFTYVTEQTDGFEHDQKKVSGREGFFDILARAKVGISVGGGGFDTLRFWETLANNCLLLTERIDIFHPDSTALKYDRIYECNNLFDFLFYMQKIGTYLRNEYDQTALHEEYGKIIQEHSTKARVRNLLQELYRRGVIRSLPATL